MRVLVDTNVVVRLAQIDSAQNPIAHHGVRVLRSNHHPLIVPQVEYEFWAVATRPVNSNGLGFTTSETQAELEKLREYFTLLRDERGIYEIWQDLVSRYEVIGKRTHDARLVAAMLRHRITHLLTFNTGHFASFTEIEAIDPERAVEFAMSR